MLLCKNLVIPTLQLFSQKRLRVQTNNSRIPLKINTLDGFLDRLLTNTDNDETMSNEICHPRYEEYGIIQWSNSRTIVVFSVLIINGSRLAKTRRKAEFILWLAQREQDVFGLGMVGFDLGDLPWSLDDFEKEKIFLLKVIESAKEELGCGVVKLGTHPEVLRGDLEDLRMLILNFTDEDLRTAYLLKEELKDIGGRGLPVEMPPQLEKCKIHRVLLTQYGCYVCNNLS